MMEVSPNGTSFFGRTYDEAMDLLHEARQYVATRDREPATAHAPSDRLLLCCEAMRVTARLTHIMAWLLAERAVQNGELTLEELAAEPYALGGQATCLNQLDAVLGLGDEWLNSLLGSTHGLYQRVMRLDAQVRNAQSRAEAASPPVGTVEDPPEGFLAASLGADLTDDRPNIREHTSRPHLFLCQPVATDHNTDAMAPL